MKYLIISVINMYQKIPFASHGMCRFHPTCSEYAKEAINMYGVVYGSFLTIKRLLRCRPGGGRGYDPVPIKEKKK